MADLGVNIAGVHFKNPVITELSDLGRNMPVFMIFRVSEVYLARGLR